MIRLKEGVSLQGLSPFVQVALQCIYLATIAADAGDVEITSTVRPRRKTGSLHQFGYAVDFTIEKGWRADAVVSTLALLLGPQYQVLDEYARPAPHATGPHIHVEYDPPH